MLIANLSAESIKEISIPFPPPKLQEQFERTCAEVEGLRVQGEAKLAELDKLFKSLLARLFVPPVAEAEPEPPQPGQQVAAVVLAPEVERLFKRQQAELQVQVNGWLAAQQREAEEQLARTMRLPEQEVARVQAILNNLQASTTQQTAFALSFGKTQVARVIAAVAQQEQENRRRVQQFLAQQSAELRQRVAAAMQITQHMYSNISALLAAEQATSEQRVHSFIGNLVVVDTEQVNSLTPTVVTSSLISERLSPSQRDLWFKLLEQPEQSSPPPSDDPQTSRTSLEVLTVLGTTIGDEQEDGIHHKTYTRADAAAVGLDDPEAVL